MTRVGYEKKAKLQIDAWNAQIDLLEAKLNVAEADAKKEYRIHLKTLYSVKADAEAKLDELKTASDEAWEDMREGYESAWDDMQAALKKAASRFT
ncbi:coiled coil domain-containing protein [uncultured Ruegeria sp.]|uniref:coiled coil domain-containing protein n=1 Tax=uncultured Ruegeria sp. TaxID=259304 RepID=UPI00261A3083|nr:coiled coil domain-containing protein [uncultured Ruegeria sp.]